jgi:hypothetical protein
MAATVTPLFGRGIVLLYDFKLRGSFVDPGPGFFVGFHQFSLNIVM